MKPVFLSIIIPCFDEMANLQKGVLDKVVHFLEKKKFSYEIIVVDDGSGDGSDHFIREAAKEYPSIKLITNNHLGKAGAVTAGVLQAAGDYILFTDMDQATPIEEIDTLLPFFEKGFDVVIGSRNNNRQGAPAIRLFISRANIFLRKRIVGLSAINDTQCGFKMFRHEVAQKLFTKLQSLHHGFHSISGSSVTSGFDVELLLMAEKMHCKIKEVPVEWLYVETRRVNPVKDSLSGVRELLIIKKNEIKGLYS
jgi:glycosyltransferase involved in cell wall biosynthesis